LPQPRPVPPPAVGFGRGPGARPTAARHSTGRQPQLDQWPRPLRGREPRRGAVLSGYPGRGRCPATLFPSQPSARRNEEQE
jgi:hypothetical protein